MCRVFTDAEFLGRAGGGFPARRQHLGQADATRQGVPTRLTP